MNIFQNIPQLKLPRMWHWIVLTLLMLAAISVLSPQQLPVILYKANMTALFAVLGYWIDRSLFPYARPHVFTVESHTGPIIGSADALPFAACMIRRALIIFAVVLGGSIGL